MSTHIHRLLARAIHASVVVDRAARRFDQARSALVTRLASHAVLDAFNDLAYERTPVYRAGAPEFRQALFNWEIEAMARAFRIRPDAYWLVGLGADVKPSRWHHAATRSSRSSRRRPWRSRWPIMRRRARL